MKRGREESGKMREQMKRGGEDKSMKGMIEEKRGEKTVRGGNEEESMKEM